MEPNAATLGQNATSSFPSSAAAAVAVEVAPPAEERPWLTFPPFPKPPPGVELVAFKDFKPLGIQIVQPDPLGAAEAAVEVDGLGIPTLTLRAHHDLTTMDKRKRKAKNRVGADGLVRRQVWYEEWAEAESMRRLSAAIDPSSQRSDRLHQAASDFKSGRAMHQNIEINQLWDRFRVYLGILSSIQPPAVRKKQAAVRHLMAAAADQADDDDDEEPDEMPNARLPVPTERNVALADPSAPRPPPLYPPPPSNLTEEQRQHRSEYTREVRDTKMDRFLNDPESSVKIFLSGYYRDRGMIFSEKSCRDGPILLEFFLNFLLRNRVFPESEKDLRKALAVAAQAKRELPHSFVVSRAIPDEFSKGCEMVYGTMTHGMIWVADDDKDGDNAAAAAGESEPERDAKRLKTDAEAAILQAAAGVPEIEVITPDVAMSMEQDMKALEVEAEANVNGDQDATAAEQPDEQPAQDSAWGDQRESAWGDANNTIGAWDSPEDAMAWGGGPTENPLCKYLGPVTLPLTHTTGVIERSVRRIKSVSMPSPAAPAQPPKTGDLDGLGGAQAEAVERELAARFAQMTLVPWHEWDRYEVADVKKPWLLPDSRGAAVTDDCAGAAVSAGPGPVHDPFKDEIVVFIEPETADKMLVGMGVDATWIQLARVDPHVPIVVDEEQFSNPWLHGKKKVPGGPGVPVELTKIWYMEQVLAVLPSFHTEMIPLPTEHDLFGDEK